ncbi:hypothetical protein QJS66_18700 [Kocuria rhizophila]|nr:hypothetical protein QJS66_18700 [Kocuria rhizophila]
MDGPIAPASGGAPGRPPARHGRTAGAASACSPAARTSRRPWRRCASGAAVPLTVEGAETGVRAASSSDVVLVDVLGGEAGATGSGGRGARRTRRRVDVAARHRASAVVVPPAGRRVAGRTDLPLRGL